MVRLKLLTFNIRTENAELQPEDNWRKRKFALVNFLKQSAADVIGFQEVLPGQMQFINNELEAFGYTLLQITRLDVLAWKLSLLTEWLS